MVLVKEDFVNAVSGEGIIIRTATKNVLQKLVYKCSFEYLTLFISNRQLKYSPHFVES